MKYPHKEMAVAAQHAISRSTIVKFRKKFLQPKLHWSRTKTQGRAVLYSDEAVQILETRYPSNEGVVEIPEIDLPAPEKPVDIKITSICFNPRLVLAKNGNAEVLSVIVPSNATFTVGDPIRIEQSKDQHGYWRLTNNPPRWRGDNLYRIREGFV